jgi:hypothetical protein
MRPRRTGERQQESLGNRWLRKSHACEGDERTAKNDYDDGGDSVQRFVKVLKCRIIARDHRVVKKI